MKWSDTDNQDIFQTYHYMLHCQLIGEKINKNQTVKQASIRLNRSHKAIECKLNNITAIRKKLELRDTLNGYPALANFAKSTYDAYIEYINS